MGVMPKLPVTVDTKGRMRTTKEQRRIVLAEFERSGVSAAQFAQRAGVKYSTFAAWVQRYGRTKRPGLKSPVRFVGSGSDADGAHLCLAGAFAGRCSIGHP
jgi:transposase-like protein